jgi:hypothetical protein
MIDSIIVMVGGRFFQQTISIDMGTNVFVVSFISSSMVYMRSTKSGKHAMI